MAVTDHESRGLQKLIPAFWGKPRMGSLLWIVLREIQLLEDALAEIASRRTIDGALETELAWLGKIVGQARLGLSVEAWRAAIRARTLANYSSARHEDLARVYLAIIGEPDRHFQIDEIGLEHVALYDWGGAYFTDLDSVFVDLLADTRAAASTISVIWSPLAGDTAGLTTDSGAAWVGQGVIDSLDWGAVSDGHTYSALSL